MRRARPLGLSASRPLVPRSAFLSGGGRFFRERRDSFWGDEGWASVGTCGPSGHPFRCSGDIGPRSGVAAPSLGDMSRPSGGIAWSSGDMSRSSGGVGRSSGDMSRRRRDAAQSSESARNQRSGGKWSFFDRSAGHFGQWLHWGARKPGIERNARAFS